ncbi:hypothetical protein [[Bacillus] enclensis]|uniref:hypothetical protein n=1 Tax=[Bacillus] enclensis TaxID=1402860 RepID=UPI0018DCE6E6|nr:hypothetical protein [[Bacillus] enclensis]MBH9967974.1 hypothetical protein [[Bacillus] enclensis]
MKRRIFASLLIFLLVLPQSSFAASNELVSKDLETETVQVKEASAVTDNSSETAAAGEEENKGESESATTLEESEGESSNSPVDSTSGIDGESIEKASDKAETTSTATPSEEDIDEVTVEISESTNTEEEKTTNEEPDSIEEPRTEQSLSKNDVLSVTEESSSMESDSAALASTETPLFQNGDQDTAGPEFREMALTNPEVGPGEEAVFVLDAYDDSGVSEVYAEFINEYGEYEGIYFEYDELDGLWYGTYRLENENSGEWTLFYSYLMDEYGNYTFLYEDDLPKISFGEPANRFPVVIEDISLDKQDVTVGENVTIEVKVQSDENPINQVGAEFQNEYGNYEFVDLYYNDATNTWVGDLSIKANYRGTYTLQSISLEDADWNSYWFGQAELPNLVSYTVDNPDGDFEGPEVTSLKVLTPEVNIDEEAILEAEVEDQGSGVDYVYAELRAPNGYSYYVDFDYDDSSGKWIGKFSFALNEKPGIWTVDGVYSGDEAWNESYNPGSDFENVLFELFNSNSDFEAPVLERFEINKQVLAVGEELIAEAVIKDDSQVDYVGAEFENESGQTLGLYFYYDESLDKWVASEKILANSKPGIWTLTNVSMEDEFQNYISLWNEELPVITFEVENPDGDFVEPEVISVDVLTPEVNAGEEVILEAVIEDDKSGVEAVTVELESENDEYNYIDLELDDTSNKWVGNFTTERNLKPGIWKVSYIFGRDRAGNNFSYPGDDFGSVTFEVFNSNTDFDAPVLETISVNQPVINAGEELMIEAEISDESEITFAEVWFENENGDSKYFELNYDADSDKWISSEEIRTNTKPGNWTLTDVYLEDDKGNYSSLSDYELPDVSYEVLNPNGDFTAPEIVSLNVLTPEVEVGEEVVVEAEVEETQSGVDYISIEFVNPTEGYDYRYMNLEFDPDSNKWVGRYTIERNHLPGAWILSSAYTYDQAENYRYYDGSDFGDVSFNVINDNGDFEGPALEDIQVLIGEAAVGEELKLEATVADDSVIEYVEATFVTEDAEPITMYFYYDEEFGKWISSYEISSNTRPGNWILDGMYLQDELGNSTYLYQEELPAVEVTVINPDGDFEAPVLNDIQVKSPLVKPGDEVVIEADVTDDKSGVDYVSVTFGNDDRTESYGINLEYSEETGLWTGGYVVEMNHLPGDWSITDVYIEDNAGNSLYLDEWNLPNSAVYTVENPDGDFTAPVLEEITVLEDSVEYGETLTVEAKISDDRSGAEYVYAEFMNEYGESYYIYFKYDQERDIWVGSHTVQINDREGKWILQSLDVQDAAGNSNYYYEDELPDVSVNIVNPNGDFTAPVLETIELSKDEARVGDEITLRAKVTDEGTGVYEVSVEFFNGENGYHDENFYLEYNETTGYWEHTFKVSQYERAGTWSLTGVSVADKAMNYSWVDELPELTYTVINPNQDTEEPNIQGISTGASIVKVGEEVSIEVEASDNLSGVERVFGYIEGKDSFKELEFTFDKDLNRWVGGYTVYPTHKAGQYHLAFIVVEDKAKNAAYLSRYEIGDLFGGVTYTVENPEVVTPKVIGASLNKTTVNVNDEFELQADVENGLGFEDLHAFFIGPNHEEIHLEMTFEENTGKWIGSYKFNQYLTKGTWNLSGIYYDSFDYIEPLEGSENLDIKFNFTGEQVKEDIKSPYYDEALWYESVGSYYNAVYFAGKAIEAGDQRATEMMERVSAELLVEADEASGNGEVTEAENAYQLLVDTTGVPAAIKEEAAGKLTVNSPYYDEALWYESAGSYYNAVYFTGKAIEAGDQRATEMMERVSTELLAEADEASGNGEITEAENAYQLLVDTTGVPDAIKEEAAGKLTVKSPYYDEALWYESAGSYYNAVYFAGQALEAGDQRASKMMNRISEELLKSADETAASGDVTEAEYAYQLLVDTTGVPAAIKEEAAGKLTVKSPYYDEALWYESAGNIYNAVYFAGKAVEDGDQRATALVARVSAELMAEADEASSNGELTIAENAYQLLVDTTGVPTDLKETAAGKLTVNSPYYDEAIWYESNGSYYNAVYFAGKAIEAGDMRAEKLLDKTASDLLLQADSDLEDGKYSVAMSSYQLLVDTIGVPQTIKDEAANKLK